MKLLTKEEEQAHYNATLKGGIGGGLVGLAVGTGAVWAASRRFPAFRTLTLPLRAFLVTSAGTFSAIVTADKYSRQFEKDRHPEEQYKDASTMALEQARQSEGLSRRAFEWGRENRYPIVVGSWVASMGVALGLVGRNPYLSRAQKLVQARVYAQGLTLAVLLATAVFEVGDANQGRGRWETVKIIDPDDPEHRHLIEKRIHHERYAGEDLWRDMVDSEERKLKERESAVHEEEHQHEEEREHKKQKKHDKGDAKKPAKDERKAKDEKKGGDGGDQKDEKSKGK